MTLIVRRILAVLIGLVTIVLAAVWAIYAEYGIRFYVWAHLAQNVPLSKAGGPRPDLGNPVVFWMLIAALFIATGCSAALIMLLPRRGFRLRGIIYIVFLAIILPATSILSWA